MRCQQTFSQASPQATMLKDSPCTLLTTYLTDALCFPPDSLITSLLLKFFLHTDTGLSIASMNAFRRYCICMFSGYCHDFQESGLDFRNGVFLTLSKFYFAVLFL